MKTFFKAQLSSLLATSIDFIVTFFAIESNLMHYTLAVIAGAIAGAITNFMINRYWSFNAEFKSLKQQSYRYALVWCGSVLLNVSGVFILTSFCNIKPMVSKIIVSAIVGLTFNYFLQKDYVFNIHQNDAQ